MLRTGVSEKVLRGIMAEDGPTVHVPERRGYGSYGGETTPAPDNLADRDFTAERPNEKWLTDITRDQGPGREVYLSPPVDCHDGGIVAYTAGSGPNAELANRMLVKAVETLPEGRGPWCIPTAAATVGGPDGWISWTVTAWHGRRAPKGCSPDAAAAEGFLRSNEDGVRLSRALGRRGARLGRRLHPLARPRSHQAIAWLDESGTIPSEPGNDCVIISKKTSAACYRYQSPYIDNVLSTIYCDNPRIFDD